MTKDSNKMRMAGKGFFEVRSGVKILHVRGTAYERGHQHGYLLAHEIARSVPLVLDGAAAVISKTISCSFETAKKKLALGKEIAAPHMPEIIKEEILGIAEGVQAGGGKAIEYDDILLWNTMYDQWCIYAHPSYWDPENPDLKPHALRPNHAPPGLAGAGCSSFSAWGADAGGDGRLIFGKNMDNLTLPGILDNRLLVVAQPDDGYGHAFITQAGMIGIDGGFNDQGLSMMTHYNASIHETMAGCGIGTLTRLLLSSAGSIDAAIHFFQSYPRCTGIAYHVAESRSKKAVVIEASARQVTVRYPEPGTERLWQTNHSNCYPGWMGYSGPDFVSEQAPVYDLKDISTAAKWQESLRKKENISVPAPSRFERYGELLREYQGKVTVENATRILSDRQDPYTGRTRPKGSPSESNNSLATICALYPEDVYTTPSGPFPAHITNLWSLVAYPAAGDFWLAIQGTPAQEGGYTHFNLQQELSRMP